MARIQIKDIPVERELNESELGRVSGGLYSQFLSPTLLFQPTTLYGSYSITTIPLSGVTVTGVRG